MRLALLLLLLLLLPSAAIAQEPIPFGGTWTWSTDGLMAGLSQTSAADPAAFTFQRQGGSAVAEDLSIALAGSPEAQQSLLKTMTSLREIYDKAVAEEGHTDNLAAAFTYFITCNLTAFSLKEPGEVASDALYQQMERAITSTPRVAGLSDGDKQKMNDWLVAMGGVALATYVGATVSDDPLAISNARELAAKSLQLVLGVSAESLHLMDSGLAVQVQP